MVLPIPLPQANWAMRVPSANQRSASTAWSRQVSFRQRVPRRRRSVSSSPATNSTVASVIGSTATYVTLTMRRTSMKLILEGPPSYPGFCAFSLHPNHFRRVARSGCQPIHYPERLNIRGRTGI